jgi:trimethylamine--corrinoid protein Co-methyltransferase
LLLEAELFGLVCHMRVRWRSAFFSRASWEDWEATGRPEPGDRARERARAILAEHEPEPLDEDVDRELRAIVDRRRRQLEGGAQR